jgi:hypothetical protein
MESTEKINLNEYVNEKLKTSKDKPAERKISYDHESKTENQNSLNVEIDDIDYMGSDLNENDYKFDEIDRIGNNEFDDEIKQDSDLNKEKDI